MNTKTLSALKRFAKVVAAAAVAVAIQHLPEVGAVIPYGAYGIAVATPLLSGLEKFLTT